LSSPDLIRWSGLAAILAGVLFVASDLVDLTFEPATGPVGFGTGTFGETNPGALLVLQSALTLLAGVLLLFGLIGLYAHRLEELGILGLFGFVVAFSGTVMAVGGFWSNIFVAPSLAEALAREPSGLMDAASPRALSAGFTLSYGLVAAGWIVLGLAALWNGVYPRAAVALLMAGAALTWLPFPLTGVIFGVAVAWLGHILYSADQAPARIPRER
jgi:hypothetical protein